MLQERGKEDNHMHFCKDVNADGTFCSNVFTFPFLLRTGWWIIWGVIKVCFPAGKFVILSFYMFWYSKIITAVVATLETIELYCVHTHTLHSHSTCTCTRTDQSRKTTTKPFNSAAAQHLEVLPETFPETPIHRHTNRQGDQEDSSWPWDHPQLDFRGHE